MAQAVFGFLMSILIGLGGSVTVANVNQDFATIYSNQPQSIQQEFDSVFLGVSPADIEAKLGIEGMKLTTEMLYKYQSEAATHVSLDDVRDSIGMNAFKNFLLTEQDSVPLPSQTDFTYILNNGFYCKFDFVPFGGLYDGMSSLGVHDGRTWRLYRCYIYQYNSEGIKIDSWDQTFLLSVPQTGYNVPICAPEGSPPMWDIEVIDPEKGSFIFKRYGYKSAIVQSQTYTCPLLISYTETETPPEPVIGTVGDDFSGAFGIAPDTSITLADGTKVYPNADGTYTIDGVQYSPTYNLAAYDDTALLDLLQTLIDAQANVSAGDTTATNYSGVLGRILSAVNSLRSSFNSSISSLKSKVIDIYSAVKVLPKSMTTAISSDLAISDEVKNKAMNELKTKVGYSAIQSNVNTISTTFFGERTFNDNGEVVITPVFDTGETIKTQRPHLYFTLFNKQYDLFSGLYMFDGAVNMFKSLVAVFIICAFVLGVFRSLPSILVSCAEVVGISNPTVITNTFSNFNIYQKVNDNKPPKTVTAKSPKEGG